MTDNVLEVFDRGGLRFRALPLSGMAVVCFWTPEHRQLDHTFAELAKDNQNVVFIKVHAGFAQDLVKEYAVTQLPHFFFMKDRQVIDEIGPADAGVVSLCKMVHKYSLQGLQPKIGELGCEDLLYAPLPDAAYLGHLVYAWDPPCHDNVTQTHPTKVEEWPHWESDVKMSLQDSPVVRAIEEDTAVGSDPVEDISTKERVATALVDTVGARLNAVFKRRKEPYRVVAHPSPHSQVADGNAAQPEPEEVLEKNVPDVCLVCMDGPQREVLQTTVCRPPFHLNYVHHWPMPVLWTATLPEKQGGFHEARRMKDALAKAVCFMARRGHITGTLSTYAHTWLLKTDKKGLVQVTPAVRHDQRGTRTKVSVTEMFLYSAMSNINNQNKEPYPTAWSPGEAPISQRSFKAARKRARQKVWKTGLHGS